jgi:hypothetical protein
LEYEFLTRAYIYNSIEYTLKYRKIRRDQTCLSIEMLFLYGTIIANIRTKCWFSNDVFIYASGYQAASEHD